MDASFPTFDPKWLPEKSGAKWSRRLLGTKECELHLEDEGHIIFESGLYQRQFDCLLEDLEESTLGLVTLANPSDEKVSILFQSRAPKDWRALARFLARARQIRRHTRTRLQRTSDLVTRHSFSTPKARWIREGKHVCRHGVFFATTPPSPCPCLQPQLEADWSDARLMPALDCKLKVIVTDTFNSHDFQRLGAIHAELRRRGW